jgi:hypothetical protein
MFHILNKFDLFAYPRIQRCVFPESKTPAARYLYFDTFTCPEIQRRVFSTKTKAPAARCLDHIKAWGVLGCANKALSHIPGGGGPQPINIKSHSNPIKFNYQGQGIWGPWVQYNVPPILLVGRGNQLGEIGADVVDHVNEVAETAWCVNGFEDDGHNVSDGILARQGRRSFVHIIILYIYILI